MYLIQILMNNKIVEIIRTYNTWDSIDQFNFEMMKYFESSKVKQAQTLKLKWKIEGLPLIDFFAHLMHLE